MTEAVIFDMDGVLVDTEPLHYAVTNELLAEWGAYLEADVYARCKGMPDETFFAFLVDRFGLPASPRELARRRERTVAERIAVEPLPPAPGALEAVLMLGAEGLGRAVASSSSRTLVELVIAKIGLAHALTTRVSVDDVEHGKPAPDLFLEAARRLRVEPAECVVIEDAVLGVRAATAAGMRSIAVVPVDGDRSAYEAEGAVRCVHSLRELDVDLVDGL